MSEARHYDTVAFDVRDNATMLFFANTSDDEDISDYLLLMRTVDEDFDESIYIEINEKLRIETIAIMAEQLIKEYEAEFLSES